MGKNAKKNYLPYVAIALALVFLIAAAFLLLEIWGKRQGRFPESSTGDGVITYQGQEYVYRDNIETFLLLGLDKFDGQETADSHESGIQTDFLMLFVFNNDTKQCSAVQINRDTMTKVNKLAIGGSTVVDSLTQQIALAYNFANAENDKIRCRNVKDSVEYLMKGIHINHYLSVTMDAVPAGCDLAGGVEVTVQDDFTGIDDTLVKGETVTLTGSHALNYVRTRYGLEDSTNTTRMVRQRQFLNALYAKVQANIQADNGFLVKFVDGLDEYVVYDSSDRKMLQYAEKFNGYEFLGIRVIDGESKVGEEFMEFYPAEDSLWSILTDLFYTPKTEKGK